MVEAELASVTLIQRTPTRKPLSWTDRSSNFASANFNLAVFPIEWYKKLMDCKLQC